jgi:hypothetical protein
MQKRSNKVDHAYIDFFSQARQSIRLNFENCSIAKLAKTLANQPVDLRRLH